MNPESPDPTDVRDERRRALGVAATFGLIALLALLDLAGDLGEGTTLGHVLIEATIICAGVVGLALFTRRLAALRRGEREARGAAAELATSLARSREEAERWRADARDLMAGLGALIDRQFVRWGLTPAEKEVALLLLKGLSHKEVAAARRVGEATVRQQATGVYKKAGVSGRHDLAAFFLEDLLVP